MAAVWTFDQLATGIRTGVPSDRLPIEFCWSGGVGEAIGEVGHDSSLVMVVWNETKVSIGLRLVAAHAVETLEGSGELHQLLHVVLC